MTFPPQATLVTYGFPVFTLATALAILDTFSDMDKARQATADRDAAVKSLDAWVKQFTKIAGVALKSQSALAKKLGI